MRARQRAKFPFVFLSFSHRDEELVVALTERLKQITGDNVTFFYSSDLRSMPSGVTWPVHIEEALRKSWCVIVILSRAAIGSEWVLFEAGMAHGLGIPIIPIGIGGFEISRHRPPLSLLQGIDVSSHVDLNKIILQLNEKLKAKYTPTFETGDVDKLFGPARPHIPAIDSFPLVTRGEIYREIGRMVAACDLNAEIRATSMIFDPDDLSDRYFTDYLETVARKCGEAEAINANMLYHVVVGTTRAVTDPLPTRQQRALTKRVGLFEAYGATKRMRIALINEHWSLNMLLVGREHAVIAFPNDKRDAKLRFGVRISGSEFVGPIVDWYDRCVESRAHRLTPDAFLKPRRRRRASAAAG